MAGNASVGIEKLQSFKVENKFDVWHVGIHGAFATPREWSGEQFDIQN